MSVVVRSQEYTKTLMYHLNKAIVPIVLSSNGFKIHKKKED